MPVPAVDPSRDINFRPEPPPVGRACSAGVRWRLPLIDALRRARHLEAQAFGLDQQRRAIAATSSVMLAAAHDGWQIKTVGEVIGLGRTTAQQRVRSARERYGDQRPALTFLPAVADLGDWTPPRTSRGTPFELRAPVEQREWLSLSEAVAYLDTPRRTIHGWHDAGLLPNTREPAKGTRLYLRADLDRV